MNEQRRQEIAKLQQEVERLQRAHAEAGGERAELLAGPRFNAAYLGEITERQNDLQRRISYARERIAALQGLLPSAADVAAAKQEAEDLAAIMREQSAREAELTGNVIEMLEALQKPVRDLIAVRRRADRAFERSRAIVDHYGVRVDPGPPTAGPRNFTGYARALLRIVELVIVHGKRSDFDVNERELNEAQVQYQPAEPVAN